MENNTQPLTPTFTPLPKIQGKAMTMDFIDAMKEILKGNKVARLSWANSDYCLTKDGWISIFTKGGFHTWSINDGDYEGEDWVVVKEAN